MAFKRAGKTPLSLSSESDNGALFYASKVTHLVAHKVLGVASDVVQTVMKEFELQLTALLQDICVHSDFPQKYDLSGPKRGEPFLYALTTPNRPYSYTLEAFPRIVKPKPEDLTKGPEAFQFHEVFEHAIQRYTGSGAKPNSVLQETRSTDFCYPVSISIEAVPPEKAKKPTRLLLLREFQILVAIWEQYRNEMKNKKGNIDQLVGFPMPFEFCCVAGTELDIPAKSFEPYNFYDIYGNLAEFRQSFHSPLMKTTPISSTLSYMSSEKLGPSLNYLIDLLRTQSKLFSLASALMVYDQLLCRLVVMHRYGVIHGDLNTDSLRFGSGNACNVCYISDYSTSVLAPTNATPDFLFHDRFVSSCRIRDKIFHFVNDLESAYYIFLLLAAGYLPWDAKLRHDQRISTPNFETQVHKGNNPTSDLSNVQKDKETFWDSPNRLQRLVNSREYELDGGTLYRNFIEDLMMTIYLKMRDILGSCSRVSHDSYLHDISIYGTAASNAYLGLRKSIASYFRFETLNPFLKDPAVDVKIGMLRVHDPEDRRVAWDLSTWCWNSICVDTKQQTGLLSTPKSMLMQKY